MSLLAAMLIVKGACAGWVAFQLVASAPAALPASAPTAERSISFLASAREVTQFIQETYWDQRTGLYAHSVTDRKPEAMWGNGVMFSALVAAARQDPETYQPVLSRFFASMDRYWDSKSRIPGYEPWPTRGNGNDKYYDDNQWMVLTFLEAYDLTRNARYLTRADQALRFSLSGWDDQLGGGIWWHEQHKDGSKNTCSNAPAAVACLRMAEYRRREQNIDWARRIVQWTNEHLQDSDGLFFDNKKVDSGKLNRDKLTYNTALMLRANLGLHRLTGEKRYRDEAKRIASACEWFVNRETGAYRDNVKFAHLQVEADLELHRELGDDKALNRAIRNGEVLYVRWVEARPADLIENASIARVLWLLAEHVPPR